jgi:hypothetical protein
MARLVTFDCPSCSAPVKTPDDAHVVHCDYCGNNLMVPESLRPPPPPPPPTPQDFATTIFINTGSGTVIRPDPTTARKIRRGLGCGGLLLVLFIVAAIVVPIGFAAWTVMETVNPGLFQEITGTGFARKELSFGGKGRGPGFFEDPVGVTSDKSGDIYVLEGDGRVQRFNASGSYLNGWVVEDVSAYTAIAADKETNEVYVVGDPKIFKYDGPSGERLGVPLEKGSGFFATRDLALFPNGDLLTFVSGGTEDLVRLDPDGNEVARHEGVVTKVYGSKQGIPAPWLVHLATDSSDKMILLNKAVALYAEVLIYDADGKYLNRFGEKGGRFTFASDIAVDGKGRVYVSDTSGIDAFDMSGNNLGSISLPVGTRVKAISTTAKDELLVLTGNQEVIKYVPR